jgi:hypothetical protein
MDNYWLHKRGKRLRNYSLSGRLRLKKVITLKQDSRIRLDTLELDRLKIRLTYDQQENISSVTFDASKKDMPDQKTMIDMVLNVNATWSSSLRSVNLINQKALQNNNSLESTIVASSGSISIIQQIDTHNGSVNTLNPILASNPINGNTLFMAVSTRIFGVSSVISIMQNNVSWTLIASKDDGTDKVELWEGTVGALASNSAMITFDKVATMANCVLMEFSGSVSTTDVSATNSANSNTPDSGTTAATTAVNELQIAVLAMQNDYTATMNTPTNGFTLLDGASNNWLTLGALYKIASAIGTANCSVTGYPAGSLWVGLIVTFKS